MRSHRCRAFDRACARGVPGWFLASDRKTDRSHVTNETGLSRSLDKIPRSGGREARGPENGRRVGGMRASFSDDRGRRRSLGI